MTYRETTAQLNRGCLYTVAELNLDSTPPLNSSDRSGYLGRNSVMMQAFLLSVVWNTGMERPTMNNKVSPKQGFRLMLALLGNPQQAGKHLLMDICGIGTLWLHL